MLDKLAEVEKRYLELEGMLSDPQLLGHQREYSKVAKERSELEEIVACYREWRKVEREIQDNLGRLMAGRTTIVIAHRLSTIREAHCIVVLEQGSIVEIGSHDELVSQRGLYYYLASQQLGI